MGLYILDSFLPEYLGLEDIFDAIEVRFTKLDEEEFKDILNETIKIGDKVVPRVRSTKLAQVLSGMFGTLLSSTDTKEPMNRGYSVVIVRYSGPTIKENADGTFPDKLPSGGSLSYMKMEWK